MSTDPEPSVRAQIVTHLSLEDVNSTLEHIVERTGDPSPLVRAAALVRASNSIPLPHLNSEMREGILKANTTEDCRKTLNLLEVKAAKFPSMIISSSSTYLLIVCLQPRMFETLCMPFWKAGYTH